MIKLNQAPDTWFCCWTQQAARCGIYSTPRVVVEEPKSQPKNCIGLGSFRRSVVPPKLRRMGVTVTTGPMGLIVTAVFWAIKINGRGTRCAGAERNSWGNPGLGGQLPEVVA
jgi:hypothetical protein